MHPQAQRIQQSLFPTPTWFPQTIDSSGEWLRLFQFTEEDYRSAAFLDHRSLREGMPYGVIRWEDAVRMVPSDARRDAHWIFQLGRVGSTLLSRLLGEIEGAFCLREPSLLARFPAVPEAEREKRAHTYGALLSRVFRSDDRAIVKCASGLNEFAALLLGPAESGARAVMLRSAPERFIAGRLAGNRRELRQRAPRRIDRLRSRAPAVDPEESPAR